MMTKTFNMVMIMMMMMIRMMVMMKWCSALTWSSGTWVLIIASLSSAGECFSHHHHRECLFIITIMIFTIVIIMILRYHYNSSSWCITRYVNTNEDVGDFRVQLSNRSGTLLVKDIGYANRCFNDPLSSLSSSLNTCTTWLAVSSLFFRHPYCSLPHNHHWTQVRCDRQWCSTKQWWRKAQNVPSRQNQSRSHSQVLYSSSSSS